MRNWCRILAIVPLAAILGQGLAVSARAQGTAERERRRTPLVQAVERAAPSVVNVSATELSNGGTRSLFNDPFFDEFFNRYFERQETTERRNLGSGFVFRKDGYVLTNHHVIARAVRIWVTTRDGREFEAKVIGSDPQFDLAVLKTEKTVELPEAALGDSEDLMTGETVIAIGNPFGLSHTVTTGVISALRRSIRAGENQVYSDFIQTDASINPGNSGGPLINILGEVIGINTAIYRGGEGIGFAIPMNVARKVARELIQYGRVHRGWFGLLVQDLTPGLRESFGFRGGGGVLVSRVFPQKSSVEGAAVGDIIVGLDGRDVGGATQFGDLSSGYLPGDLVKVVLVRKGERLNRSLSCQSLEVGDAQKLLWDLLGFSAEREGAGAGVKGMVVTRVRPNTEAQKVGLEKGDLLVELNQASVGGLEQFVHAVAGILYHDRAAIKILRGNRLYSIILPNNI